MGLFSNDNDEEMDNIILTTTPTIPNKEIIKIISMIEARGVSPDSIKNNLKKEAIKIKADAVVGISSSGILGTYGTAVKLKDIG